MADQLTMILRKLDGRWELRAAVGEPGREHARDINRNVFDVDAADVALATGVLARAAGDAELEQRVEQLLTGGNE